MSEPPVIAFTPVPLRQRADGWSPDMQLRFIVALSNGLTPGEAARSVGKNRQNAYALRKRPGAESFAAAWDAAVAHVRRVRAEGRSPLPRPGAAVPAAGLPARPRPKLPQGAEAEAIAQRGAEAMSRAPTQEAARRSLDDMPDALYGPKNDKSDTPEGGKNRFMGSRTL